MSYDVYDGATLPYSDGCFDLAFAICVVHHVPPRLWNVFASEMRRVLKPAGLALVFEHNPRNPLTMRVVNSCPFDADAVLLRNETAEALLSTAGFSRSTADLFCLFPLPTPGCGVSTAYFRASTSEPNTMSRQRHEKCTCNDPLHGLSITTHAFTAKLVRFGLVGVMQPPLKRS